MISPRRILPIKMSGSDFITIVDDDGQEFEVEVIEFHGLQQQNLYVLPSLGHEKKTILITASFFCASWKTKTAMRFLNPSTMKTSFRIYMSGLWFSSMTMRRKTPL